MLNIAPVAGLSLINGIAYPVFVTICVCGHYWRGAPF